MPTSYSYWDNDHILLPNHSCLKCQTPINDTDQEGIYTFSCPNCGYNMESIPLPLKNNRTYSFLRGQDMEYCPFSGYHFTHTSDYDYVEFAHGGLRNSSIHTGSLFGTPRKTKKWEFQHEMSVQADNTSAEKIVNLLTNKGQVYGITNKSRLLIFALHNNKLVFKEVVKGPEDRTDQIIGAIYIRNHVVVLRSSSYIRWDLSDTQTKPAVYYFDNEKPWGPPLIIDEKEGVFALQFFAEKSSIKLFGCTQNEPIFQQVDIGRRKKMSPAIFLKENHSFYWANVDYSLSSWSLKNTDFSAASWMLNTKNIDTIYTVKRNFRASSLNSICTAKFDPNTKQIHFFISELSKHIVHHCETSHIFRKQSIRWDTRSIPNEVEGRVHGIFLGSNNECAPIVLVTSKGICIMYDMQDQAVLIGDNHNSQSVWFNTDTIAHPIISPLGVLYRMKNYVGLASSKEFGWMETETKAYALSIEKRQYDATSIGNNSFVLSGNILLVAVDSTIKMFTVHQKN